MIIPFPVGRIWWFRFYMGPSWKWLIGFGLSPPSLPACPKPSLLLETFTREEEPGCKTPHKGLYCVDCGTNFMETLVPDEPESQYNGNVDGEALISRRWPLGDWVTYDNPAYVDCDGTLHAKLEMTLKKLYQDVLFNDAFGTHNMNFTPIHTSIPSLCECNSLGYYGPSDILNEAFLQSWQGSLCEGGLFKTISNAGHWIFNFE
ncbi:hypothetical protein DFJ58DRAFT_847210 [Suillus subalutaceus]|uniref:uncharacterized protein n=1 Tax=Suillus subalutaceus TaxID=48586 RepID=UPI001B8662FE|nr:uncharacterized protein DFJ58DRAFT_847210 [Suillus subalutaceus]KAG1835999.1 hypothetical protein DFJ58DRAFT_847210 [Suillus subalutaceus]